jgi:hypothetical protein
MFNACKSAGSTEYSAIPMEEGGNASLQFLPPLRPLNESEALVARRKCKRYVLYFACRSAVFFFFGPRYLRARRFLIRCGSNNRITNDY